jgi:hypothetical protein
MPNYSLTGNPPPSHDRSLARHVPALAGVILVHFMVFCFLRDRAFEPAPAVRSAMQLIWVRPRADAAPVAPGRSLPQQVRAPLRQILPPASTAEASPRPSSSPVAEIAPEPSAPAAITLDVGALRQAASKVQLKERATDQLRYKPASNVESEQEKIAKKIAEAARPDCLTSFQGMGVLAVAAIPLAAVLDKKDSGCKF